MKKYLCVAFALAFLACGDEVAFKDFENKSLTIEKITLSSETFTPSSLQDESANITFTGNQYNGFSGCNRFFGSFSLKNDKISFEGNGGSTKMLCPPEVMGFEDVLLGHLNGEFTLTKENEGFILHSNEIKIYLK